MALPTMPSYWQDKFQNLEAQRYRMRQQQEQMNNRMKANARFFQENNVRTKAQNYLLSNQSYDKSMKAYSSLGDKAKKSENLMRRRHKLGQLLQRENNQYEVELKSIRNKTDIEEMKERTEELKSSREEKRKQVAQERLYEHWKENNHGLRDVARDLHQKNVTQAWVQQAEHKKEKIATEDKKEREYANEYERTRIQAIENQKKREEERMKREKERMEMLKQQMIELKNREEQAVELRKEDEELQRQKWKLQKMQDERDVLEQKRKSTKLQRFLHHQYKAQMRRRTQQVQEELELDRQILLRLQEEESRRDQIDVERQNRVKEDVKWMKKVIEEQVKVEKKREEELDLIYREEARRMWDKREEEWSRERDARKKLMSQVMYERSHQIEARAGEIREDQERLLQEREDLLEHMDDVQRTSRLNKEEEEEKKRQRREELDDLKSEREERVKTARGENDKEELNKVKKEQEFREMFEEEKKQMQQQGHVDRVFPRTRRAWD